MILYTKLILFLATLSVLFTPIMVNADTSSLNQEVQHLRQRVSQLRIDMQKNDLSLRTMIENLEKKIANASNPSITPTDNQQNLDLIQQLQEKDAKIRELEAKLQAIVKNVTTTSELSTATTGTQSSPTTSVQAEEQFSASNNLVESNSLYNQGINFLSQSNYIEAEKSFSLFINMYPQDQRLLDAKYWLGESFYYQNKFQLAFIEYNDIANASESENHWRSGQALFKSGLAKMELETYNQAEEIFNLVVEKYPNSDLSKEAKS